MTAGDRFVRAATAVVVVALGGIAAYVSYTHALEVAQTHGEAGPSGRLLPLTIDGLVFVASMVMLDSARRGGRTPRLAGWALGAGIGATVAVNIVHGIAHGPIGAAISAWPAVTLVLVVELLMDMIRRGRTTTAHPPAETVSEALGAGLNGRGEAASEEHAPGVFPGALEVLSDVSGQCLPAAAETLNGARTGSGLTPVPEQAQPSAPGVFPRLVNAADHRAHHTPAQPDQERPGNGAVGMRSHPGTVLSTAPAAPSAAADAALKQVAGDVARVLSEAPENTLAGALSDLEPALSQAREHFAEDLAVGRLPSARAIMRTVHVGHDRATRIRQALIT